MADTRPLGRRRQRRTRPPHPGVRRHPFPGRDQPDLPARPAPLVDRRQRGRIRQARDRSARRRTPRRRHRPRIRTAPARGQPSTSRRLGGDGREPRGDGPKPTGTATITIFRSTCAAAYRWPSPPNRPARSSAYSKPPHARLANIRSSTARGAPREPEEERIAPRDDQLSHHETRRESPLPVKRAGFATSDSSLTG
jgi:hypothetical protein